MIYIIIFGVIILMLVIGYYFFHMTCNKNSKIINNIIRKNTESCRAKGDQIKAITLLKKYDVKDLYINSFDNLKLHGTFIEAKKAKRLLICSHGYKGSFLLDFCYLIEFFLENNTSLLLIDQRACSKSEGKYITFGALEKHDLVNWINYMDNLVDLPIYLYGISLGSSTTLMALGENIPKINGVIADCGYSSMKNIFSDLAKSWFHIPAFPFISIVGIYTRIFAHFKMKDADAVKALENNTVPILFIHGKEDDFVKPINTVLNYNATKGEKEIMWVEKAKHAESSKLENVKYQEKLKEFFKKYDA